MQQDLTDAELWSVLSDESATATATRPDPPVSAPDDIAANLPPPSSEETNNAGLDEEIDFSDDQVERHRTITTFASSPIARTGLIGVGVLVVVAVIGAMVGGFDNSVKEAAKKPEPQPSPTTFASPMVPGNPQANGALKAQMAFQSQQQSLNAQKAQKGGDTKVVSPPAPTIKPTARVTPTAPAVPAPPAPAPVAVEPFHPIPEPVPAPRVPPVAQPLPVAPIPLANLPPLDPNKAWQDLSQSATYGSLPTMVMNPPPALVAPAPAPAIQNPQSDMGGLPSLSSYHNLQSFNLPSRRKLRIGTQVKAKLMNPIAWSGDGKDVAFSSNGAATPKFIAKLEEPLNDADGNAVVPQGAELVVAVRSLEPNSGMAELTALQLIIDNQEFAPPIGALTLRGANGNPLIADKFQDKGKDIAAADRAMFLFGALSKVGELLNRTNSSVVITANGSSSSSSSGNTNIFGGVLQGGFGALAQQQQQRNQQWYQEILRRPDIRYIPAGKDLSLYVNQSVTL